MAVPKSQFDYVDLLIEILSENPLGLSERDLSRDIACLRARYASEGLSFLTKTLPKLGKALDAGMADTQFTVPREFAKRRSKPEFLRAYFNLVFADDGSLLADANPDAVRHLRQVLLFVYKLELGYTEEQELAVVAKFLAVDDDLELEVNGEVDGLIAAASYVIRDIFVGFDPDDIIPKHGPGAVSTGEKPHEKFAFKRFYHEINTVYPYLEYFMVGGQTELVDRLEWYNGLERLYGSDSKVVLVPKDSKGPRLISVEPLEKQFVQGGLGRLMACWIEDKTRRHVNFVDQGVNRNLAMQSSIDMAYATLDLSDASDRVGLELVKRAFRHTNLTRYLLGTRSQATILPTGERRVLNKFASMGSALCFPVESILFYALAVAAISRLPGMTTRKSASMVYVYGDDIVVPTDVAHAVITALEAVKLKVNREKCCIAGPFRESCGMDAFKGMDVTPTRLRTPWSGKWTDGGAYASYISLHNSLRDKGYVRAAEYVLTNLERLYGKIPCGTDQSSYPCVRTTYVEAHRRNAEANLDGRWNDNLQRFEWRVLRLHSKHVRTEVDSWSRLLRNVTSGPGRDPDHVVLPRSTQIKRGWAPV